MGPDTEQCNLISIASNSSRDSEVARNLNCKLHQFDRVEGALSQRSIARPACILNHVQGLDTAIELSIELSRVGQRIPTIHVFEKMDIDAAVQLMNRGAVTVLDYSSSTAVWQGYVESCLKMDDVRSAQDLEYRRIRGVLESLTARQVQVLRYVVSGMATKGIAINMSISQRLVEKERSEILRSFEVQSTPDVTLQVGEYRILRQLHSDDSWQI